MSKRMNIKYKHFAKHVEVFHSFCECQFLNNCIHLQTQWINIIPCAYVASQLHALIHAVHTYVSLGGILHSVESRRGAAGYATIRHNSPMKT